MINLAYNIYNLTEEGRGGNILTDEAAAALTISNIGTGYDLSLVSSVTTAFFIGTAQTANNTIAPAAWIQSGATAANALYLNRTVVGSPTVATLILGHPSAASAPLIEFGHFASITSVVLTTVANTDFAIRVQVGNTYRWIPLFKDAALIGTAAF